MTNQLLKDLNTLAAIQEQDAARRCIARGAFKRVNSRRGDLIQAKVPVTDRELAILQDAVFRVVEIAHPRPPLPEIPSYLLAKLARDELGKVVRDAWVKWANEQPNPKASWLLEWDRLEERDKEVDRRIGDAVVAFMKRGADNGEKENEK
jgi:hypothetical protein